MEIHQALTRSPTIQNHLLRHEQGESFVASGYAQSTGKAGLCVATSGPGARYILEVSNIIYIFMVDHGLNLLNLRIKYLFIFFH